MARWGKQAGIHASALALCAAVCGGVKAAPPGWHDTAEVGSHAPAPAAARSVAAIPAPMPPMPSTMAPARALSKPLDLSLPKTTSADTLEWGSVPFPSRRTSLSPNSSTSQSLGSEGPVMRNERPIEEMARRFRREGLPIARLWQTHNSLLSLGLNQHGKPGLWLTQKTH